MSKIIAVFGATGSQGGAVLKALVNDGKYHIRAITRNVESDKAKKLAQLNNVSLHQADLDDASSVDKALINCYGAFLVTDYSAHLEHKEVKQGTTFIDNAIKNKVSHVVFSGLDHVQPIINKPCLHFDYKAAIEDYGLQQIDKINFTSIRLAAYYQVLPTTLTYKVGLNQFLITLPMGDKPLYCINVDDIGESVRSIFNSPNEFKGKIVPVAGDLLKPKEIEDTLNKHLTPNHFTYANFSLEKFASLGFDGAEELANMFEFYQTGKLVRDIDLAKRLNPNTLTFDQWIEKNKDWLKQTLEKK